ncbi:hypothetical protein EVG17_28815, partial [Klebsiella pneumoniae]
FASDRPEEVDRQITHWLQALQQTTPEQQLHYYQYPVRQRPAGRGRPADNPLAAGATANDA